MRCLYSHLGKHAQKPNLASMNFLKFSAWPRGIAAYPQTLSLGFKSSLLDYSASSSKVYVSPHSFAVLAQPSSPQRWGIPRILSWFTYSQSVGPIRPYLMHLGKFRFVCGLPGENILLFRSILKPFY